MAIHEDRHFVAIIRWSVTLLLLLSLASGIFCSTRMALGVLAGGGIAIVNFFWIRAMLGKIIGTLPSNPERRAGMSLVARLTITGIVLYLLLVSGSVPIAGLLVGLSVIVLTLICLLFSGIMGRQN